MQSDSFTRIVLSLIFLCALLLVIQGYGARESREVAAESGRFKVVSIRSQGGVNTLLRVDTHTGRVWSKVPRGGEWRLESEHPDSGLEVAPRPDAVVSPSPPPAAPQP